MRTTNSCFATLIVPVVFCNSLFLSDIDTSLQQHSIPKDKASIQIPDVTCSSSATLISYTCTDTDVAQMILHNFATKMLESTLQNDPDVARLAQESFWDLV